MNFNKIKNFCSLRKQKVSTDWEKYWQNMSDKVLV